MGQDIGQITQPALAKGPAESRLQRAAAACYPLQPLVPIAPPPSRVQAPPPVDPPSDPALNMQQSREAVSRAGEAHCKRFNDPVVCHEKK